MPSTLNHRTWLKHRAQVGKALVCAPLLALPASAFAYIDPNAGGILFQLLLPVFAAIMGVWIFLRRWVSSVVRRLWHRVTRRDPE